jgi:hypothetical protein
MNTTSTEQQTLSNVTKATVETAPPAALAAWHCVLDQPIEKWLTLFAILYTVLQIVVLIRKEFIKRGGNRK